MQSLVDEAEVAAERKAGATQHAYNMLRIPHHAIRNCCSALTTIPIENEAVRSIACTAVCSICHATFRACPGTLARAALAHMVGLWVRRRDSVHRRESGDSNGE